MERETGRRIVESGLGILGIELGSTRIKAVLTAPDGTPLAQGSHHWESRLENGNWTYSLEDVRDGLRDACADLAANTMAEYGARIQTAAAMGVSAMMHGYLAFDADGNLLVPFRTWRNTSTRQAAEELSASLRFNIPQRWSAAHLYQAILNGEPHLERIAFLTTLSGYVHWQLTGERVLGIGDAAGMFPVDGDLGTFDPEKLKIFDGLARQHGFLKPLGGLLPRVLRAGTPAGTLTEAGARLLDPTGGLRPGVPMAPPEGDAGTGMAATDSLAPRTGNVSAGTSIFAMVVLEKPLSGFYPELDVVATPAGRQAVMVHCNNGTADLDAWVRLLREAGLGGGDETAAYEAFYRAAMAGQEDCGGVTVCNYLAGEPVAGLDSGIPLVARLPDGRLTLGNFARAALLSTMTTLKLGMELLTAREDVSIDALVGHGGLFQTGDAAQHLLAGLLNVPVRCMETAGTGGPWGMALLASYLVNRRDGETLEDFLHHRIFQSVKAVTAQPAPADIAGGQRYLARYQRLLRAERTAVASFQASSAENEKGVLA
jgi:sugar (pentulose or hexulose) kinase